MREWKQKKKGIGEDGSKNRCFPHL